MKLSVLMPVYNENATLDDILDRVMAARLPSGMEIEVIAVDDGSTDGSWDTLLRRSTADPRIKVLRQPVNRGKGASIRAAVQAATGDVCLMQDADLEYNPRDYPKLINPILEDEADVVYGSRFAAGENRRVLFYWHSVANRMLTSMSNVLTDLNLTDMETGYKAFRTSILKTIPIRSNRFGIEPELTAKVAKRKLRIFETSVSYNGRTYMEGKKIGFRDAVQALWVMLKYHFIDDLYSERYGEAALRNMELATRFSDWLMQCIRPYLSGTVLEIGAGIGNNVRMMAGMPMVIASESDPEYARLLKNAFAGRCRIRVVEWDVTKEPPMEVRGVDSVLCSNVLEHIEDESQALRNTHAVLKPGGRVVFVVPAGERLFGTVDEAVGHVRRYNARSFETRLRAAGFDVERVFSMNKVGVFGWILNGKILRRKSLGRFQMKAFNAIVPVLKLVDRLMPWTGLSLVVVARRRT